MPSDAIQNPVVLYLDDDPDEAYLLERVLSRIEGLEPTFEHLFTPDELLARLDAGSVDVLILDHELGSPETGLDVLRRVREGGYSGAVVMLTAHEDDVLIDDYLRAGADAYVCKADLASERLGTTLRVAQALPHLGLPAVREVEGEREQPGFRMPEF